MLSLSGFVLAVSVVIGQAEQAKATAEWPPEAVKCTEYLMGTWDVEGTIGEDTFKGTWSCRWAPGRCAYYMTGSGKRATASDQVAQMAALGGFDVQNKRYIEQGFWSNGDMFTGTYPFTPGLVDRGRAGGQMTGIQNGKEVKAKLDVERKGPMEFVWSSTGEDGTRSSLTFKKTAELERGREKAKQRR